MANIAKWLKEEIEKHGETIEAIVVGKHDSSQFDNIALLPDENIILSPEIGLKKLDVEYSNGFGAPDCFPMYAWTKNRVYFIAEYDGSTGLNWIPRNPIAIEPHFSGQ